LPACTSSRIPKAIRNARLGTTIATNAVLERKGAVVAYRTTEGFRDVIFIQRGNRKSHYDMSRVKPKPLVKRRHCFEVAERIDKYGNVITALDEAGARAIRELHEIEAVAISSKYANIKLQPGVPHSADDARRRRLRRTRASAKPGGSRKIGARAMSRTRAPAVNTTILRESA
jgi:Hydantoinase/oxoprolinase N-terminal region